MNLRTIIIFALLVCACILPLHAQVGEQRHNFAVGVNGGINLNSVKLSPSVKQKNLMGINGGVTARYISEKYFSMICGAQIGELLTTRLGRVLRGLSHTELHPHHELCGNTVPGTSGIRQGPRFAILHPCRSADRFPAWRQRKIDGDWDGTVAESYTNITVEQHGKAIDNKFDYGIAGGAGIEPAHQGRQFHRRRKILLCFIRFLWQHQERLFLTLRTRSHYGQDNLSLRLEEVMLIGDTRFHT